MFQLSQTVSPLIISTNCLGLVGGTVSWDFPNGLKVNEQCICFTCNDEIEKHMLLAFHIVKSNVVVCKPLHHYGPDRCSLCEGEPVLEATRRR
jgi:hypothetical protein